MISIIKNICIFMIIVQAVLFFVPSGAYMKYVRILVGILLILRITETLFGFLLDEGQSEEIRGRLQEWENSMEYHNYEIEIEDGSMGIYSGIEEELKGKLEACESDYQVKAVELVKGINGDDMGISVTVAPKDDSAGINGNEVKAGERIQIEPVVVGEKADAAKEADPDEEKSLWELKVLYGNCIGVAPERMEIRYEADFRR